MDNDETMTEYEEVSFIDENGDEARFLHILTFNYEGGKYGALVPIEQIEEDEPEVLFVRITHDSDGDAYIPVDNEVLLEELFAEFSELIDEMDEDGE